MLIWTLNPTLKRLQDKLRKKKLSLLKNMKQERYANFSNIFLFKRVDAAIGLLLRRYIFPKIVRFFPKSVYNIFPSHTCLFPAFCPSADLFLSNFVSPIFVLLPMNRNGKPIINFQSRETGEMIIQTEEMNEIKLTREYNIL